LAGYATVVIALLVVYFVMGTSEIYIDGAPTAAERIVLSVIALAMPLAVLVGWSVSRLHSRRAQSVVSIAAAAVAAVAGVIQGGVLQHLRVATGVDDQPDPPMDHTALPTHRDDRLHRLGEFLAGQADAAIGQRATRTRS
jgi:hypothetical protein